ncbi:MAG: sensor histidine kinase [Solirubrobacterales bacterium]
MIVLMQSMRRISTVGKKLIVLIVAFSSLVTLFVTALQLFMDYRVQRAGVDELMRRVGVFFPPIAASVWSYNDQQIALSLEALVALPNIERATVVASDGSASWQALSGQSGRQVVQSFPLSQTVRGEERQIATIEIAAGLDSMYETLLWQGLTILLSNGFKTFLVAAFMYAAFRHLVTLRIEELARRVAGLMPQVVQDNMSFPEDTPAGPAQGDEIDAVRWAFDGMAERLKLLVADLNARNLQLAAENQERHRAEAELRQVVAQLSKALTELERFAYVAAHDLKEPIRSIVSFSQLLQRRHGDLLSPEAHEFLSFIINEALRLSSLVGALLDYSRCEGEAVVPEELDCGEMIRTVVASLGAAIEQKQAEVTIGPLPRVQADRTQMGQLFQNLLTNALKYSRPGEPPRIAVTAERVDDVWRFTVSDNGIGIEPQYADYVFEVFRRLHTRDSYSGTGIGLAICKRVVENHGGRIWLDSVPGQGTAFHFTLPDAMAPVLA